eukprot:83814_1
MSLFKKICKMFGIVTALLIIRKVWYILYRRYKKYPPGPVGLPFFGCLFSFSDLKNFQNNIGKSYYPVTMFPFGPKTNMIMISDLNLVCKIYKTDKFAYKEHIGRRENDKIPPPFTLINDKHEMMKRRKLFYNSVSKITNSSYLIEHVQDNIKNKTIIPSIENAIEHNYGLWCPRAILFNFAFNTIFGASFGPNLVKSLNDEKYKEFQAASIKIIENAVVIFLIAPMFGATVSNILTSLIGLDKVVEKRRKIINEWIDEYIQNKQTNQKQEHEFISFIDGMLNNSDIGREKVLSDINMTFTAGSSTTAESIELMLMNAAKYPDTQNAIYLELCQIFENSKNKNINNMLQLNKAHHLRAFVEESFRQIATCGIPRQLQQDFRLNFIDKNGNNDYYILPKGAGVVYSNGFYAANGDYGWKNANNFDINNYLNENNKFIKTISSDKNIDIKCKFSIFGYGIRKCPGMMLAKKQIILVLSILFYKYKFCGPKGETDTDFVIPKLLSGVKATTIQSLTVKRR